MENIDEKMANALDLINESDFMGASKILKEILNENPQNLEALKNLGLCEVNLDNPIEALKSFKKAVEIDENDATSLYYFATCLARVGEKEKAVEKFNQVIELRPDYLEVYKALAMIYIEFSQIDNAIKLIKKALENPAIEPDHTIYYIIATAYLIKKNTKKAVGYLESAYSLANEHIPIMNSLGSCYTKLRKYDLAIDVLAKAFELDENNSLTSFNLATVHYAKQNYQLALKYYQISYQLEPSVVMMSSLANCAVKAGEFSVACVIYKNLLMIYPNNTEYRLAYVECLDFLKDYNQALDSLNMLLEQDPKNVTLIKKKGALLRKLGFCNEAIDVLQQLLNRGKIDVELYYNFAYCYVQLGDFDNAKEMFKKCIILEPENPYAHKDLGVLYLKMNCYEWAVDEMLEAIKLEDGVGEFYYSLGVAYVMLSDIKKGKIALLKAVELEPDNADALAFLGYVYLLEKDYVNTLLVLEKALDIDPNNFLAKTHSAKFFFETKKYKVAIGFLIDIVEKAVDDEMLNMLAICYMETDEYENAMGILYKLATIYPKNHILLTNLAKCEYKCGKKDEALEHLRQALMVFDDYDEALKLLEEINNGK